MLTVVEQKSTNLQNIYVYILNHIYVFTFDIW